MTLQNKVKQSGFTIVELLIVVVVIAILAAITIVAYNGIQNRAKSSAAQALANNVAKKAEAYNTVASTYGAFCQFREGRTDSTGTAPYTTCSAGTPANAVGNEALLDTSTKAALRGTDPTDEKTVRYYMCDTGAGARVVYYDVNRSGGAGLVTINIGTSQTTCA
ncbi:prepilin-type N-terminal cleavage/methylation domain-containing protein [Patescibacteria group bacterium]|nr:prepilin-type N-terminal cleavage/methylation domain-containing protein [Patescibacteria group bacterium]